MELDAGTGLSYQLGIFPYLAICPKRTASLSTNFACSKEEIRTWAYCLRCDERKIESVGHAFFQLQPA